MIRLSEAELTSVLPDYIKSDVDIQAISYAYKMGIQKLLSYSMLSELYGNIDNLPNTVLDLLALELRSQYYDESMDIGIKRNIIRNSLAWYAKGGTVSAVQEMVQTVFGEGQVIEWFDFGGEPGTFYVETDSELSPDGLNKFQRVIEQVKNSRSHLINVKIKRKIELPCPTVVAGYAARIMIARVGGEGNV